MSKYILVVDDNPSDLMMTSFLVEQYGFLPIRAQNGFEALEKVDEFPIEAFIIDLQMPHMTGLDLIRRIRAQIQYESLPILVLSARREERDVRLAIQYGANDYIVKPSDPEIFEEKLLRLLGKSEGWSEYLLGAAAGATQATLVEPIELISLSEVGITFYEKMKPQKGDCKTISSAFLDQNGLSNLNIVIKSFEPEGGKFRVSASFIGLPEVSLKKLRILCQKLLTLQPRRAEG